MVVGSLLEDVIGPHMFGRRRDWPSQRRDWPTMFVKDGIGPVEDGIGPPMFGFMTIGSIENGIGLIMFDWVGKNGISLLCSIHGPPMFVFTWP